MSTIDIRYWPASAIHNFAIETPDLPQPYNRSASPQGQGMYYPNTNNTLPIVGGEIMFYNWSGYLQWQAQWAASF